MKPFEFTAEADEETREAAAYFEERATGLGRTFIDEIHDTIRFICQFPETGRMNQTFGTRSRVSKKFRYVIHYLDEPDRVVVIAVAHGRRRPGYWRRRLK